VTGSAERGPVAWQSGKSALIRSGPEKQFAPAPEKSSFETSSV